MKHSKHSNRNLVVYRRFVEYMDYDAPSKGDTVRVTNTETGDVLVEGEVEKVTRFAEDDDPEKDNAVYLEIREAKGQVIQFKTGEWDGTPYSWAERRTDTMGTYDLLGDYEKEDDIFSAEIV